MKNRSMIMTIGILTLVVIACTTQPVLAMPVWVEGRVTAKPWFEKYRHIQVEGKNYTLMPDIQIYSRYQDRPGAWAERQSSFYQIRKDQKIQMRVEGSRVYQILIYE